MGNDQAILIGLTTYSGDVETRQILKKTLRHLRRKNKNSVDILVVSDGYLNDPEIHFLATHVIERAGPSGLQQGELDSIWQIVRFAQTHGYRQVIKSAGDIIMTVPDWTVRIMERFYATGKQMLSTHWFKDDSWVVGTKFFVADVQFLEEILPEMLGDKVLEIALTESISQRYQIEETVYLINSSTGERHEVKEELKTWGWEHAHRLSKFVKLDEYEPFLVRLYNRCIYNQILRFRRDLYRSLRNFR